MTDDALRTRLGEAGKVFVARHDDWHTMETRCQEWWSAGASDLEVGVCSSSRVGVPMAVGWQPCGSDHLNPVQRWKERGVKMMLGWWMAARSTPSPPPRARKRIAVMQYSGLGDALLAMPTIAALHQAFPEADIDIVTESASRFDILRRLPGVKEIVEASIFTWRVRNLLRPNFYCQVWRPLVHKLRQQQYDLLVNLHLPWQPMWLALEWLLIEAGFSQALRVGAIPSNWHRAGPYHQAISEIRLDGRHYCQWYADIAALAEV